MTQFSLKKATKLDLLLDKIEWAIGLSYLLGLPILVVYSLIQTL